MRIRQLPLAVLGTFIVGCGTDPEALREWTPEDHAHPAPSRQPINAAGQQTGDAEARHVQSVAALWRARCASCHGEDGVGIQNEGESPLQDLSSASWQDGVSDEQLAAVIQQGKGSMPAFGPDEPPERKLNALGVQALVQHIRRLRR